MGQLDSSSIGFWAAYHRTVVEAERAKDWELRKRKWEAEHRPPAPIDQAWWQRWIAFLKGDR
jgi:hypothetical protein